MKDSLLISVRLAKAFLVIMALMLLVFIVCYATKDPTGTGYDEFTSPRAPFSTRDKILGIALMGFVLAIPFSWALNAIALYVNREVVKVGRFLQASLVLALIGFVVTPVVLLIDENIPVTYFALVAAVPVGMWLVSCFYLFRLESKERKIIPDDSQG